MFLISFRNILCPQQMFPGLRGIETTDEQQCVRNIVSSFATTLMTQTTQQFVEGAASNCQAKQSEREKTKSVKCQ